MNLKHMPLLIKILCLAGALALTACNGQAVVPGTGGNTTIAPTVAAIATSAASAVGTSTVPNSTDNPTGGPTRIVITVLPAGTTSPAGLETPLATAAATSSATSEATAAGTPAATSEATSGATPAATGEGLTVTLADDGKTINLKVGQTFLLDLGEGFDWNPVVANQNIVSRVIGITVIRGAQGVYRADAAGTTTLSANGEPACRQSKPACGQPSRLFQVTINVVP